MYPNNFWALHATILGHCLARPHLGTVLPSAPQHGTPKMLNLTKIRAKEPDGHVAIGWVRCGKCARFVLGHGAALCHSCTPTTPSVLKALGKKV